MNIIDSLIIKKCIVGTLSLIIKKCIVGTLSLGLAGSGTNKFSSLTLENLKNRPLDDALRLHF